MNPAEAEAPAGSDEPTAENEQQAAADGHDEAAGQTAPKKEEGLVLALWLPSASLNRLQEVFGCEITVDAARSDEAKLVAVSTRATRARVLPTVRDLRAHGAPIAVVCHAGGEQVALEIMRAGAAGVVAEGHELALRRLIEEDGSSEEPLVLSYEQRMGAHRGDDTSSSSLDRVTGLPALPAFETRLNELIQSGTVARVGFMTVDNFAGAAADLAPRGRDILRRRLAAQYRDVAARVGAEIFSLAPDRFAFVGRDVPPQDARTFGTALVEITESFAPNGTVPLVLGVGHAGPEISSDINFLKELAERALENAVSQEASAVINAEELSNSMVSSTELEMALKLVSYLDELEGRRGSHSHRVADYASELGRQLGLEGRELSRIRVAALLHDVGKVGLPPEAVRYSDALTGDSLEAYRSHPERGARYLALSAGKEVADAVRSHHENWDGTGFPLGQTGEDIPLAARIIAVADAFDSVDAGTAEDAAEGEIRGLAVSRLKEGAGTRFDNLVVEVAINSLDL